MLDEIATGNPLAKNMSLLKYWCETKTVPLNYSEPPIYPDDINATTKEIGVSECKYKLYNNLYYILKSFRQLWEVMKLFPLLIPQTENSNLFKCVGYGPS